MFNREIAAQDAAEVDLQSVEALLSKGFSREEAITLTAARRVGYVASALYELANVLKNK